MKPYGRWGFNQRIWAVSCPCDNARGDGRAAGPSAGQSGFQAQDRASRRPVMPVSPAQLVIWLSGYLIILAYYNVTT